MRVHQIGARRRPGSGTRDHVEAAEQPRHRKRSVDDLHRRFVTVAERGRVEPQPPVADFDRAQTGDFGQCRGQLVGG